MLNHNEEKLSFYNRAFFPEQKRYKWRKVWKGVEYRSSIPGDDKQLLCQSCCIFS